MSSETAPHYVVFSAGAAAVELWGFGEDELAEQMLTFVDDQMIDLWRPAAHFYDKGFPLPVSGRKICLGQVTAFACMFQLEGELRPLSRQRRRPSSSVPSRLERARAEGEAALSALQSRLIHNE